MPDKEAPKSIEDRVRDKIKPYITNIYHRAHDGKYEDIAVSASISLMATGIAKDFTTLINDLITKEVVRQSKKRGKLREYYHQKLVEKDKEWADWIKKHNGSYVETDILTERKDHVSRVFWGDVDSRLARLASRAETPRGNSGNMHIDSSMPD